MAVKSWRPRYSSRITRRGFLAATSGAGVAALIACGGKDDALSLKKSIERTPGAVLYSRESYLWPDETKSAVAGGIYPGSDSGGVRRSYDRLLDVAQSVAPTAYESILLDNRGPGIDPASVEYVTPRPGLAEALEVANDGLTYTFTLRRGVKFHRVPPVNGREMNIEDWRSTLQRYEAEAPHAPEFKSIRDKVEYPDARHMVIKLKQPYGAFAARLVYNQSTPFFPEIMPRELNENPELAADAEIGTNYRTVSNYQPLIRLDFARFDDYWQGKPFIDRWHYPIIPEYANRLSQFITKHIISFSPTPLDALSLKRDKQDALMIAQMIDIHRLTRFTWGKRDAYVAPWADPRVRIAMHRAVNWDAILDVLSARADFRAAGVEIESAITTHVPNNPLYWLDPRKGELGQQSENYLYNVAEAKKLVSAAGYPTGFEMPMIIMGRDSGSDDWTLYNDEIKRSGIVNYELDVMTDSRTYFNRVLQSNDFKGRSWQSSSPAPDVNYYLSRYFTSDSPLAVYTSAKLDQLYAAQLGKRDLNERAGILKEMQREAAAVWPVGLGGSSAASWTMEWPWLHNAGYPDVGYGHLQWLDPNMPKPSS